MMPRFPAPWIATGIFFWVLMLILVWWQGPALNIMQNKPLAGVWARVVFTLVWLWLIFGITSWCIWKKVKQLKAEQHIQESMESDPVQPLVDAQQQFLDSWLQVLREHVGSQVLYRQPWYLVIGLSGSGKSSLIHRANPANKLNPRLEAALRDYAPDLHVDCWVGEQAVMLDPRGYLLDHSPTRGEKEDNSHERLWLHLLNWLSQHRRRQPLNGVVLTLDLAWLAQAGVAERKAYAQLMRARLQEMSANMHTCLPLYITLTKLDMLHGFDVIYQQLDKNAREAVLGITFSPDAASGDYWLQELAIFWEQWLAHLNTHMPTMMLGGLDASQRSALFLFVRQLAGIKDYVLEVLGEMLDEKEQKSFLIRGVYTSSVYQQGVPFDAFMHATTHRYQLSEPVYSALRGESNTFFVRRLFADIIFPEADLAGESRVYALQRQRRVWVGISGLFFCSVLLIAGWQHFYHINDTAVRNVLTKTQSFTYAEETSGQQEFGYNQLPRLNLIRQATLSFGDYREKVPFFVDLGLYQGNKIGPYVEKNYLELLSLRFLPAVMQGLLNDLNQASAGSEQKLAILRVMRMLDDASGRNKTVVEQFMAQRWQRAFPEQGQVQEQLMQHLDYALQYTNWNGARQQKDLAAIAAFIPFQKPIYNAQHELSKLPMFQRVYQNLRVKADNQLSSDLMIQDEVGPIFDTVFTLNHDSSGNIPRLMTWSGLSDFYLKQDNALLELTEMDSWVLGQRQQVHLSQADRGEIIRQVNDRYVADYINQWQTLLRDVDIQALTSLEQALSVISAIISNDQPFQRVLTTLNENTRHRQQAGENSQILTTRIGQPFIASNAVLVAAGEQEPLIQQVNQKMTELYHYLDLIVNATDPGQSALKAVQLRLNNKYSDPVFALQQYARNLPVPLDRWVSQLAEQSAQLVVDLAISSLNQAWLDQIIVPFNTQLADRYPFDPSSTKDAPLSEIERFFSPNGTLDSFYQANLKPMVEGGLMDADLGSPIQLELLKQLERATQIRETFFNSQGSLEVQFALEPIELTANKRRSVLNLDGQLLEYAHGRRNKIPLIWPNSMRDGAESKITLVPDNQERSPRSEGFIGPWAMFRLMQNGELTQVNEATFDVRFPVDQGAMTYRVYADASHNPFAGGLFSQFRLPESLY
ncbi:MAG: type VI secretion system membrane subunit TssM [Plesiomonas sp.]